MATPSRLRDEIKDHVRCQRSQEEVMSLRNEEGKTEITPKYQPYRKRIESPPDAELNNQKMHVDIVSESGL